MTTLQPIGDNVLVEPISIESTTASGIIIPDTASKEKPRKGTVISISQAPYERATMLQTLSVGDIIYFSQYAPTEIKVDGKELYILDVKSVLAVEK